MYNINIILKNIIRDNIGLLKNIKFNINKEKYMIIFIKKNV